MVEDFSTELAVIAPRLGGVLSAWWGLNLSNGLGHGALRLVLFASSANLSS